MSWLPFIPLIEQVLERVLPDPKAKEEAKWKLMELADKADERELDSVTRLALAQLGVNAEEAKSSSLFVAGWRPFIGWVCGVSLACYYIPYTLVATVLWATKVYQEGFLFPRPDLGIADLIGLVTAMLGLATLRTGERLKGVVPPQK